MSQLKRRVADLEGRFGPSIKQWVRIFRYEDQTQEEAIAAYEAEQGPINDKGIILRVFIRKPFPAPVHA